MELLIPIAEFSGNCLQRVFYPFAPDNHATHRHSHANVSPPPHFLKDRLHPSALHGLVSATILEILKGETPTLAVEGHLMG